MKFLLALAFSIFVNGQDCGPDGSFGVAGSTTVFPLAESWAVDYTTACPNVEVTVEGGGSSAGARAVCAAEEDAAIGMMSRGWKSSEGSLGADGFTYTCLIGDMGYSAAQIVVANDGVTVLSKAGGAGADCIGAIGGLGLSADQLRWVFSSYTADELEATGWDPESINSDGDDDTHLWSELNEACPDAEIHIAIPNDASGTYEFFSESILSDMDNGEGYRDNVMAEGGDTEVLDELRDDETAIGYVGFPLFSAADDMTAVSVEGVFPTLSTISEGCYSLLGRQIYMNLRTSEAAHTVPYVDFGLLAPTVEGYVPLSEAQDAEMHARLESLL